MLYEFFFQILLHTPTFLPKLKKFYRNKVEEETLIYNLIELSENPYDTKFLYQIKKIISKNYPKYGLFAQNDTQNFAIDFIDSIINEIKPESSDKSDSIEENEDLIENEKNNKIIKMKKYNNFINNYLKEEENTFIEDLFVFIDSSIKYNGKLIITKKIKFDLQLNIELTFPVDNLKDNYSLYELLDNKYTNLSINEKNEKNIKKGEIIQDAEESYGFLKTIKNILLYPFNLCFKNEKKKNEIKNMDIFDTPIVPLENNKICKISNLPKILIITLIRGIDTKSLTPPSVSFPDVLEMKNYVDNELYDLNFGTSYTLYAINIRAGYEKYSGHCYSYVKVDNDWICFNDNSTNYEKPYYILESVVGLYYIKENYK